MPCEADRTLTLTKALYSLAATLVFALPLVFALATKPVPYRYEVPIDPPAAISDPRAVPFPSERRDGDVRVFEGWLRSPAPTAVMSHVETNLQFYQSDKASFHPVDGIIEVLGTNCRFTTAPNSFVDDVRPLRFIRGSDCRDPRGATGELKLTIRMGGPGDLRIYSRALPEAERVAGAIYVGDAATVAEPEWLVVMGWFIEEPGHSPLSRAHLLSYVWTTSTSTWPVWLCLAGSLCAVWCGLMCFPFDSAVASRRFGDVLRAGVGAGALSLGLGGLYALITPPFQAADESHHFASYAVVVGRPSLTSDAVEWAKTGHHSRIARHQFERFRPKDIGRPEISVDGFIAQNTFKRSSLNTRLWQAIGRATQGISARRSFIGIRAMNALLFSIAVGGSAALFATYAPVPFPQLLIFPLFLVPALPFFGMHFGESALVASISVVFAALVALTVVGGDRFPAFGLLLGLVAAAFATGARNAIPMLLLVETLLILRVCTAAQQEPDRRRAVIFWLGFAIGASPSALVLTEPNRIELLNMLSGASERLPVHASFVLKPWFPFVAAAAGYGIETVLRRPLRLVAEKTRPIVRLATMGIPVVLVAVIIGSFVGSLYWDYPIVESIQGDGRASLGGYFIQVASTLATMFRWTRPSMLLESSFWVGFGWLDTIPPAPFTAMLVTVTGASVIGLLVHIARHREVRLLAVLTVLAIGGTATIAGYVYLSYAIHTSVHGRYLLGWYLTLLAVCWTWPAIAPPRQMAGPGRWPSRVTWQLITAGFVHAYAMRFVLQRYF